MTNDPQNPTSKLVQALHEQGIKRRNERNAKEKADITEKLSTLTDKRDQASIGIGKCIVQKNTLERLCLGWEEEILKLQEDLEILKDDE